MDDPGRGLHRPQWCWCLAVVSAGHRELTGDEGGKFVVSVLDYLHQIKHLLAAEFHDAEVDE